MIIIKSLEFRPHSLAFKEPIRIKDVILHERRFIALTLTTTDGLQAEAEVSPLPGLHQETIEDCIKELVRLCPIIEGTSIHPSTLLPFTPSTLHPFNSSTLLPFYSTTHLPSVRCGLEMAMFLLLAKSRGLSLSKLLNPQPLKSIPINALIRNPEELRRLETGGTLDNLTSIKIKLGRQPLKADIEMIKLVTSQLPSSISLRLDVNQGWGVQAFNTFIESVDMRRIEYIEEPVKDYLTLSTLEGIDSVGIALDESLITLNPDDFVFPPYVKTFVLKPMVLGGIIATLKFADLAKKHGRNVVISSAYESPAGLDNLHQLALALHQPDVAAGLDTGNCFKVEV